MIGLLRAAVGGLVVIAAAAAAAAVNSATKDPYKEARTQRMQGEAMRIQRKGSW